MEKIANQLDLDSPKIAKALGEGKKLNCLFEPAAFVDSRRWSSVLAQGCLYRGKLGLLDGKKVVWYKGEKNRRFIFWVGETCNVVKVKI